MGQPVTIWYVTYNFRKCNVVTLIRYDCHADFKDLSDTQKGLEEEGSSYISDLKRVER